jgi:hypothetical protein
VPESVHESGSRSEILKKHYGLDYNEVIGQFADEQALAALKLSEPSNDQELEKLQELAKLHPLGALLSAWSYFEKTTDDFVERAGLDFGPRRPFAMELSRGRLAKYGVEIPDELKLKIDAMRHIRNMAAHGHAEPTREDVINTINAIESLEKHLETLDVEKIRLITKEEKEAYERIKTRREMELEIAQQRGIEFGAAGD